MQLAIRQWCTGCTRLCVCDEVKGRHFEQKFASEFLSSSVLHILVPVILKSVVGNFIIFAVP